MFFLLFSKEKLKTCRLRHLQLNSMTKQEKKNQTSSTILSHGTFVNEKKVE